MEHNMHRTQIMLDEVQYHFLVGEARRLRVSMSEILRRMVTRAMAEQPTAEDPIESLAGIGASGAPLDEEDHDRIIYGLGRR
jgi:hypothetical protein